jgi:hypothetical protein
VYASPGANRDQPIRKTGPKLKVVMLLYDWTAMLTRRQFLGTAGASFLAASLVAEAQKPVKPARIGYLLTGSLESPETRAALDAFRQGLRERGYVEGQNVVIEYRTAEGRGA